MPEAEVRVARGAHFFDVVGLKKIGHLNVKAPSLLHWIESTEKMPGIVRVHYVPDGNNHEVNVSVQGMRVKNANFMLAPKGGALARRMQNQ